MIPVGSHPWTDVNVEPILKEVTHWGMPRATSKPWYLWAQTREGTPVQFRCRPRYPEQRPNPVSTILPPASRKTTNQSCRTTPKTTITRKPLPRALPRPEGALPPGGGLTGQSECLDAPAISPCDSRNRWRDECRELRRIEVAAPAVVECCRDGGESGRGDGFERRHTNSVELSRADLVVAGCGLPRSQQECRSTRCASQVASLTARGVYPNGERSSRSDSAEGRTRTQTCGPAAEILGKSRCNEPPSHAAGLSGGGTTLAQ